MVEILISFIFFIIACLIGYIWVEIDSKRRKTIEKRKSKFVLIHSLNDTDALFESMLRVKKKDWLVLLAYYLITLPFFTHEFISDEPYAFGENTSMIIVLGMCILMWGIFFFSALMVIFGCCFFLFYLFVCMLHLMCFLSTTEEKKYFKEKFSKEWFYTNLVRMNIFVWNLIISILAFSYLVKIFSFFKGEKGTFGGGGASGKY